MLFVLIGCKGYVGGLRFFGQKSRVILCVGLLKIRLELISGRGKFSCKGKIFIYENERQQAKAPF